MGAFLDALIGHPRTRAGVNRSFHRYARRRTEALARLDPVECQRRTLLGLIRKARHTRFGRDHTFSSIRGVPDFQKAVPLRTYEQLWDDYLRDAYPVFDNLTWPGLIPYLGLSSGTTTGVTKYLPVSRAMVASNRKAGRTMLAYAMAADPGSRLFGGRLFFLGGSTALERPAPGVEQGDLSGIMAGALAPWLRAFTFPPLDLALEPDWDRKLSLLAERASVEPITLVAGVPSWLLALAQRLFEVTGKTSLAEVWPGLERVVHGGVKFDPYAETFRRVVGSTRVRFQDSYACTEGFVAFGDPDTGLLRLCLAHGLFYEFVPTTELGSDRPTRHWLRDVQTGIDYAVVLTTCAGLWGHIVGDTVRFESLDPPLLTFTGRTKYGLSAFGEHLISEEVEAALATASRETSASVRDWHLGPVFFGAMGHHLYVIEFIDHPSDLPAFRDAIDRELSRRNADYRAHRAEGVGLPAPALVVAARGGLDAWLRSRGMLGGQHKFPRMDGGGRLTAGLVEYLRANGRIDAELPQG